MWRAYSRIQVYGDEGLQNSNELATFRVPSLVHRALTGIESPIMVGGKRASSQLIVYSTVRGV